MGTGPSVPPRANHAPIAGGDRAPFDAALADERAEAEYNQWLAEVSGEATARDEEEDSEFWGEHLSAFRSLGLGVAA